MSAGYAERLSEYPNKGECGLPENYDSQRAFNYKLDRLSQLIQQSNYTVVLTGAGISTSAGIPDFRGPSGIWTKEQQERKNRKRKKCSGDKKVCKNNENEKQSNPTSPKTAPTINGRKRKQSDLQDSKEEGTISTKKFISFETALPTYTHRALTHLILHPPPPPGTTQSSSADEGTTNNNDNNDSKEGNNNTQRMQRTYLHHIVTQNVDGLHRKTNLPRHNMSILHGCIFTEICDTCNTEHVRTHEIQSIGLKHTGRDCTLGGTPKGSCPGKLKDTLLDWEDDLPEVDWGRAEEVCSKADLVLCLGTSLRIEPAGNLCTYPLTMQGGEATEKKKKGRTKKKSSKKEEKKLGYAIVNLQQTPYDDGAALVVRGKVDDVMKVLMFKLGYGNDWDDIDDESAINDDESKRKALPGEKREQKGELKDAASLTF